MGRVFTGKKSIGGFCMIENNKALQNEGHKINSTNIISNISNECNILPENVIKYFSSEFENDNIFVNFDSNKKPYTPNSYKMANSNNSSTWGTLEQALISIEKYNRKGIGIEFGKTSKGHLCGLDIDNCIDDNGIISPEAESIIKMLDTYTEISISGKGIHCLFYATKKGNACKNNKLDWCKVIELYDKERYFTLSGNVINDKGILYRQEFCNMIYDKYFACCSNPILSNNQKCKKEFTKEQLQDYEKHFENALKKDPILRDYWNGKRPNNDESANDLGFCKKLSYWLNDENLVKEYFLKSPYFAQKDEKHKEKCLKRKDYLQRTISFAMRRV